MLHTTWFKDLFGFDETSPETVSQNLEVVGKAGSVSLHSKLNHQCFPIAPSLDDLRHQVRSLAATLPSDSHLRWLRYKCPANSTASTPIPKLIQRAVLKSTLLEKHKAPHVLWLVLVLRTVITSCLSGTPMGRTDETASDKHFVLT